jgi:hypothetical protein
MIGWYHPIVDSNERQTTEGLPTRPKRLRVAVLVVVGFFALTATSAATFAIVAAESARYCGEGLSWIEFFHPRILCTPFGYGAGESPHELLEFLRTRNKLQIPIYQDASISNSVLEISHVQIPGQQTAFRNLIAFQLSSTTSFSEMESRYQKGLSSEFKRQDQFPPEGQQEKWNRQLQIPPNVNAVAFLEEKSGAYQGVVLWSAPDKTSVQICVFEVEEGKK